MSDLERVLEGLRAEYDSILRSIQELVEFETPSSDLQQLDAFAKSLAVKYAAAGADCEILERESSGNHLKVTFPGQDPTLPPAMVMTHFDTVWPVGRISTHPFRIEEGRAYGPAIFDMKASLAVMEGLFQVMRRLKALPPRPITLLCTADEEIGSESSRDLIEETARASAYVLVLEPPLPGGSLKTARKGSRAFTVRTVGVPAHSGIEIEKGVNAIEEACHHVLTVQGLTNLQRGLTANVGVLRGGTGRNVVADSAEFSIDLRGWTTAELDEATEVIQSLRPVLEGSRVEVEQFRGRPALEPAVTGAIFSEARRIAADLDQDLSDGGTGGGSDGNLTGAVGAATLDGLGVPGDGAHADHEHIELDRFVERAQLIAALLWRLPTQARGG